MEEQTKAGNSDPSLIPVSQSSRASTHALKNSSPDQQIPGTRRPHESDPSSSIVRRATGPRTLAGKEQSKHNALKHGILSKVLLLKSESRREFDCLWNGLRADRRPVGTLEEILVEKLAVLTWRYRRLIAAETGEIRKNTEFPQSDGNNAGPEKITLTVSYIGQPSGWNTQGLIRDITDPAIRKQCLELLSELHENLKTNGFRSDEDQTILHSIYGTGSPSGEAFPNAYAIWSRSANCSEEERQKNGYPSTDQCVAKVLDAIANETRRLRKQEQSESKKAGIDKLRSSIPRDPSMDSDRLLRYEATINREFDRTLNQLERAQRMRLGQPVLPTIKVDLSST
jgi:hypothetical protein